MSGAAADDDDNPLDLIEDDDISIIEVARVHNPPPRPSLFSWPKASDKSSKAGPSKRFTNTAKQIAQSSKSLASHERSSKDGHAGVSSKSIIGGEEQSHQPKSDQNARLFDAATNEDVTKTIADAFGGTTERFDVAHHVSVLCEVLELATYAVLHARKIYPEATFEKLAYRSASVVVPRSSILSAYVKSLFDKPIRDAIADGRLQRYAIAIFSGAGAMRCLERFTFELPLAPPSASTRSNGDDVERDELGEMLIDSLKLLLDRLRDTTLRPLPPQVSWRAQLQVLSSSDSDGAHWSACPIDELQTASYRLGIGEDRHEVTSALDGLYEMKVSVCEAREKIMASLFGGASDEEEVPASDESTAVRTGSKRPNRRLSKQTTPSKVRTELSGHASRRTAIDTNLTSNVTLDMEDIGKRPVRQHRKRQRSASPPQMHDVLNASLALFDEDLANL